MVYLVHSSWLYDDEYGSMVQWLYGLIVQWLYI